MRAARLAAIEKIELCDIPRPHLPAKGEVLVRVGVVGVCGSDMHYYRKGRIGEQVISFPQIPGHEMAGTVERIGHNVTKVKPGDRIAVDPAIPCHACDQCSAGRFHTCRNLKFLGCPGQLEGCLTEYIIMPEECCLVLPDTIGLETGALCEPLTIGYYATERAGSIAHKTIGILGAGPIGLSVMLACSLKDAGVVFITDRLEYRLSFAKQHGSAVWAGNPDTIDIVSTILEKEPAGLDIVFECCGQQEALDQAFSLVKPGGSIVIVGIPEFDRYSFAADTARRREVTIIHVRRQNNCTETVIGLVASGKLDPGFMITHRFPLHETEKAFRLVSAYADNVVKVMIHV